MKLIIRAEKHEDYSGITEVHDLAFGQKNEGRLVELLRKNPDYIPGLSLIAESDDKIIGHILFFPVVIRGKSAEYPSLSLAPVSVLPEYQGRGVGKQLVSEGLQQAKGMGFQSVIVLGHPGYYPKFGFKLAGNWNIKAPFAVPVNAFFALELRENGLQGVSGTVRYPKEFHDV